MVVLSIFTPQTNFCDSNLSSSGCVHIGSLFENEQQKKVGSQHTLLPHVLLALYMMSHTQDSETKRQCSQSWFHHHHLSFNCEGHWCTADDFTTSFLRFSLFSTALWDLPNSRPVHSLMLSSHLFLCLPCLLPTSLCLARWFWPDLMNQRHDHTTAVCTFL